jgi:hypothetical protein
MQIQVTEMSQHKTGFYFSATCGKTSAYVVILDYGVRVCCLNAAHKVWKGAGKFFPNAEAAISGYRSGEMKALIEAAVEASQIPANPTTH